MKSIKQLLRRCWKRFRYVIHIDGDPYLVRYRLISTPWFGIYLHHILRSDRDRELHNHPWRFWSLVLRGGYWEIFSDREENRKSFSLRRRYEYDFHRVQLKERVNYKKTSGNKPGVLGCFETVTCWSLVVVGRKRQDWGFMTEAGGFLNWQEFHKAKGYDSHGNRT